MSANPKPYKGFKWMGFKSHMLATMAKWREADYFTDTVFQCVRILPYSRYTYELIWYFSRLTAKYPPTSSF